MTLSVVSSEGLTGSLDGVKTSYREIEARLKLGCCGIKRYLSKESKEYD